jgi:hypothetical protein
MRSAPAADGFADPLRPAAGVAPVWSGERLRHISLSTSMLFWQLDKTLASTLGFCLHRPFLSAKLRPAENSEEQW